MASARLALCRRYGGGTLVAVDVPERIEIEEGSRVIITWDDGGVTEATAAELRAGCPCAACREPDGRERTEAVLGGPVEVTIADSRLVGGYALGLVFSPDGHSSGIFPFDVLRRLGSEDQDDEESSG